MEIAPPGARDTAHLAWLGGLRHETERACVRDVTEACPDRNLCCDGEISLVIEKSLWRQSCPVAKKKKKMVPGIWGVTFNVSYCRLSHCIDIEDVGLIHKGIFSNRFMSHSASKLAFSKAINSASIVN